MIYTNKVRVVNFKEGGCKHKAKDFVDKEFDVSDIILKDADDKENISVGVIIDEDGEKISHDIDMEDVVFLTPVMYEKGGHHIAIGDRISSEDKIINAEVIGYLQNPTDTEEATLFFHDTVNGYSGSVPADLLTDVKKYNPKKKSEDIIDSIKKMTGLEGIELTFKAMAGDNDAKKKMDKIRKKVQRMEKVKGRKLTRDELIKLIK